MTLPRLMDPTEEGTRAASGNRRATRESGSPAITRHSSTPKQAREIHLWLHPYELADGLDQGRAVHPQPRGESLAKARRATGRWETSPQLERPSPDPGV